MHHELLPYAAGHRQSGGPLVTRYHYDLAGRLIQREVPTTAQAEHDGPLAAPLAALLAASTQHFSYDKAGRLIQARCEQSSAQTTVRFNRDTMGRLSEESLDCQDSRSYTSAGSGAGTSNSPVSLPTSFSHTLRHRYDELGVRSNSVLPHVGSIDYLHYGSGHLHQVAHNQAALVDFERDALHREVLRSLSGVSDVSAVSFARELDPLGRLASVRAQPLNIIEPTAEPLVGGPASPTPTIAALSRRYAYDPIGQLIAIGQNIQAVPGHPIAPPAVTRYRYDAAHRLVGAHYPDGASQAWRFDPAGNRLPEPVPGQRPTQFIVPGQRGEEDWTRRGAYEAPAAQCYPDNRVQQVSTPGGMQQIEYDAWGNVRRMHTSSGPQQGRILDLLYDGLHQLRASRLFEPGPAPAEEGGATPSSALQGSTQGSGQISGQFTTTYYDYDALGRRISKTSFTHASGQAATMARRSWFGWDGDRLVSTETNTAEGRERLCTVYEPQSFVPLLRFAWVRNEEGKASGEAPPGPQLLYYHCNHIGTPEALIDRQGQIVWQAEFDPWGNLRSEFNPQQIDQAIRMQGQQLDLESGLFYNRYRYYEPGMGRYVQSDPIGLAGGLNAYQYVSGNPISGVDPLGLAECVCTNMMVKRKDENVLAALRKSPGDNYGHWWTEIDGTESYGWWPKNPVGGIGDTLKGVPGELNGQTAFGGTARIDPHHGDSANVSFNPKFDKSFLSSISDFLGITTSKSCQQQCKEAAACFRKFAGDYSGSWAWKFGYGQNCHTFQEEGMKKCNLKK